MESHGFIAVNGRSNSDNPANITFASANGTSIIDLVWVNLEVLDIIQDFEIVENTSITDHFPCALTLNFKQLCMTKSSQNNKKKPILKWNEARAETYQTEMLSDFEIFDKTADVNDMNDKLIRKIKEAAARTNMIKVSNPNLETKKDKNKPWFDLNCLRCKRTMKKELRTCKKNNFDPTSLYKYIESKKEYKKTIDKRKETYMNNMREELSNVKNTNIFWKTVKKLKTKRNKTTNSVDAKTWETYYYNFYNLHKVENLTILNSSHPFLDCDITIQEITETIHQSKTKKSPGNDNVPNEFYKFIPNQWIDNIKTLINKAWSEERTPKIWSSVELTMLYKKGDRKNPSNYRGIALINTIAKIFTKVIQQRVQNWSEENGILKENQAGFRRKRGCVDHIYTLNCIIQISIRLTKGKLYAAFIDFKKAFDSISHCKLWNKLSHIGISGKLIKIMKSLYDQATMAVNVGNTHTKQIKITRGVLQGDPLSPLLFSLFISDIEAFFKERGHSGININGNDEIMMLMYADDMVILSNSAIDLQKKLDTLAEFCQINDLQVNTDKTKIVKFRKSGKLSRKDSFRYISENIEIVKNFTYLGVQYSSSGIFLNNANLATTKANRALNNIKEIMTRSKTDSWYCRIKLFDNIVSTTLLYASEVWSLRYLDLIEKSQNRFLKYLLSLPNSTPQYILRKETGRQHTSIMALSRTLTWWRKILQMSNERFPKKCYNRLIQLDSNWPGNQVKFNWVSQLKNILEVIDLYPIWTRQNPSRLEIEHVLTTYNNYLSNKDLDKIQLSAYSPRYKHISGSMDTEEYLLCRTNICKQRIIAQLRMCGTSVTSIKIKDRHYKLNSSDICQLCSLNEQEDLAHFICRCPQLQALRNKYIKQHFIRLRPGEENTTDEDNLQNLLTITSQEQMNNIYYYVTGALRTRDLVMN